MILTLKVRCEQDVVLARQRARQLAQLLGFALQDQTRIATAVSEIARNAFQYAGTGKVEFQVRDGSPASFVTTVQDQGPGIVDVQAILEGRFASPASVGAGAGLGISGTQRLMDQFQIESAPGQGTTVRFGKALPQPGTYPSRQQLARITEALARCAPESPLEEIQRQNRELLHTLEELQRQQTELAQLNRELEDTNRGVVALYAELDDRADYLQRASELKSHFLSNMSHEFRTPLNAILSLSQLLLERSDGELTSEQEKQVTFVSQSAQSLSDLVNDLLDLAKVEAGKITIRPSEFEVADLFSVLRGMLRPLLSQNAAINLIFEEPSDLPALYTDESRVSQILRNFISNALKFTEQGEIRISATLGPDQMIVFAVADTGIGIEPEDQRRIFEEFTQIESPVQAKLKGTGLGLPLSRRLAELLGGTVWVKSELGVGSSFFAAIPSHYAGLAEVYYRPEILQSLDEGRATVLIVEDNRETLFLYEKYLQGSDFQIIAAATLKEARALLPRLRPAVVILDILLQGENSWGFMSELKENEATRGIPVLVATLVDNQAKALSLGADAFCIKPVERTWLLEKLQQLTQIQNPAQDPV
ncbi:ATP-binding protein [Leptolyngbya sp. FACHB-261]|nr:ATP-binding protein [Leptolyngbya sp. FACHB-261]